MKTENRKVKSKSGQSSEQVLTIKIYQKGVIFNPKTLHCKKLFNNLEYLFERVCKFRNYSKFAVELETTFQITD